MFKKRVFVLLVTILGLTSCDFSFDKLVNQFFHHDQPNSNENTNSENINSNTENAHTSSEEHFHSFVLSDPSEKYLANESTCQTPALYYYSCVCGEHDTRTFEYGSRGDHFYIDTILENSADFTYSGRFKCEKCKYCNRYKYPTLYKHPNVNAYFLYDSSKSFLRTENDDFVSAAFQYDYNTKKLKNWLRTLVYPQNDNSYLVDYYKWNDTVHSWSSSPYAKHYLFVDSNLNRVVKDECYLLESDYSLSETILYEYENDLVKSTQTSYFEHNSSDKPYRITTILYYPENHTFKQTEEISISFDADNQFYDKEVTVNRYLLGDSSPYFTETKLLSCNEYSGDYVLFDWTKNELITSDDGLSSTRTYYQYDFTNNNWEYIWKLVSIGEKKHQNTYIYRFIDESWVLESFDLCYQNDDGLLIKTESYEQKEDGTFLMNSYSLYSYDENDRLILLDGYLYNDEDCDFLNDSRQEFFYDDIYRKCTYILYRYDYSNGCLTPFSKSVSYYTKDGAFDYSFSYIWDSDLKEWIETK